MSFNLEKVGKPIARITGGKYNNKVVSITDDKESDEVDKPLPEVRLPESDDGKFQQMINPENEREILYITGPSGSGKSFYSKNYIKEWKKKHKDGDVYLFSSLQDDKSLDDIKPKRVKIDDRLISDPLRAEDFKDCLVIFDDIDVIDNKPIRKAVYHILNQVLEIGRHYNIFCIVTNHLPSKGDDTKRIINECHTITFFPKNVIKRNMKYFLENYAGIEKDDLKKIRETKSRWATIYNTYPQCVLTEKALFTLDEEE